MRCGLCSACQAGTPGQHRLHLVESLAVDDRRMDDVVGPDPLAGLVPAHLGDVAKAHVVDVEQHLVFALLVPDLVAGARSCRRTCGSPFGDVSTRPAVPVYCRATPADLVLFFRKPVSSTASTAAGSPRFATTYRRATRAHTRSRGLFRAVVRPIKGGAGAWRAPRAIEERPAKQIRESDALSPLCSHPSAISTHRGRANCRILLKHALVAQRTEHLTTDRFSFPAVLTREHSRDGRPVCTESDA